MKSFVTSIAIAIALVFVALGVWSAEDAQAQTDIIISAEQPRTFRWDPNQEADMSHYHVYLGTQSGVYDVPESPIRVEHPKTNLDIDFAQQLSLADRQYFIAVTAVDLASNESDKSIELTFLVDNTKPGPVVNFIIVPVAP